MSTFTLHPRLENDSDLILSLALSDLRLMNNAAFPWVLLIPKRNNCVEIIDLNNEDRSQLFQEIVFVSEKMRTLFKPTKLNVANLGNQVSQLHVHIIARYDTDGAWPNPVWGSGVYQEYSPDEKADRITKIQVAFS